MKWPNREEEVSPGEVLPWPQPCPRLVTTGAPLRRPCSSRRLPVTLSLIGRLLKSAFQKTEELFKFKIKSSIERNQT